MVYTNNNVPMDVSADVTAGMLLEISGDGTVAEAAADSVKVLGVAYADASLAQGEKVAVITGVEVELTASGAITAGDIVKAGAGSTVVTGATAGQEVGMALNDAADAEKVRVLLLK